jgi:hypothetical protein
MSLPSSVRLLLGCRGKSYPPQADSCLLAEDLLRLLRKSTVPGCQDAGELRGTRVSLNAKGPAPRHGSCSSPPFPDRAGSSVPLDCAVGHVANRPHGSEVGTGTSIRSSHWQRWSIRVPHLTCGGGRLQKKNQKGRHARHCFVPGPLGMIQDQIRIRNRRPSFRIPGKIYHPRRGRRSQILAPKAADITPETNWSAEICMWWT